MLIAATLPVVLAVSVAAARPASAFIAPPVVKDVSADSVSFGQLFGGRNEALAVNPVNQQIVLAASEFGGLWRSGDGGAHWTHVDALPLTSMDDVRFASSDPSLVVATGEHDGVSSTTTAQVYVSRDGGGTWTLAAANSCGGSARSAHKVSIGAGTPGSLPVLVATDCGLVRSNDSGSTWSDVTPNGVNSQFWDVQVLGSGPTATVYACGGAGFFRSADAGTSWTQNNAALSSGTVPCRIATAPGNASVVLLASYASAKSPLNGLCMGQLLESDDGGSTFTNLNPTQDGNCRPANAVAVPGFAGATNTQFEVFFATDSNWLHQQCDLANITSTTTACTVGNGLNGGSFAPYDGSIAAIHNAPDSSALAFGADGCPFLSSGDGGIFSTSNGCAASPTFATSNIGMHALQADATAGSSYAGHTDLYFSTQDNGIWNNGAGGAGPWGQQGPDVYGVFADQNGPPSQVLYKECCFVSGGVVSARLFTNNEGMTSQGSFTGPPGTLPAFGNILGAQFGFQSYALATQTGTTWRVYVTTTNGATWTQMGPDLPPGSNPRQLLASGTATSPTFYLLNRVGTSSTVSRLAGPLTAAATFTTVGSGLSSPSLIAVDPTDPLQLYAEDDGATPALKRSSNGGASFTPDSALTNLVRGGSSFALPGSVTAIGLDGSNNTVMVGTVDNGIFASVDGGGTWSSLSGSTQISRSTGFFFDNKTGKAYTASAGRAQWEIALPRANLAVTKTHSPSPVLAGNQLTYTITVTNNGPDAASGVTVTDTLPAQAAYLTNDLNPPAGCTAAGQVVSCSLGDLANGQSVSFHVVTLVDPATVATAAGPTSITNSAIVSSSGAVDPDQSDNAVSDTALVNDSADLQVTKLCKPDTTIYAGTPITCTVYVDNHGPSYARAVTIDDTVRSDGTVAITNVSTSPAITSCSVTAVTGGQRISCAAGTLPAATASQVGRVTLSYTMTATEGQNIDNQATVRSNTPDPDSTNNTATVNLTVTALADLAMSESVFGSGVAGTALTWTSSTTNNGPSTARNVVLSNAVPPGVQITSVSMPGATCAAGLPGDATHPTTCSLGSLSPGATSSVMTVQATIDPRTTGTLHDDALVSSDTFDNNNTNDRATTDTTVLVHSALTVTISATPNPVTAGTPLSYQITVGNSGPSTARAVTLVDQLPAGVTFSATGGVGTCGYATNTSTVTCQLPDLDPGSSVITYVYTAVRSSTPDGPMSNTVSATATGSPIAMSSTSTGVQTRADLAVLVTSDALVYKPSTTIHYQITITNNGPSDARNVVLTQALPAVKQGKYVSNNVGCPPPSGTTLTCQAPAVPALASLASGATFTLQVNFFITGNKGTITSSATVTSLTTDPVTSNNGSTRVVTVK